VLLNVHFSHSFIKNALSSSQHDTMELNLIQMVLYCVMRKTSSDHMLYIAQSFHLFLLFGSVIVSVTMITFWLKQTEEIT
jgi:hypothetical protein